MDNQQQPNMQNNPGAHHDFLKGIENFFEKYLLKEAPFHLPENAKEWIVKYGPWITLVLLVLSLPVVLAAFGLASLTLPFAAVFNPFSSVFGIIHWLIILGVFILEIIALPGLFKRELRSWYLIYYASLLQAVGSLISRDFFGLIIGTLISMFILFQIKAKYH